MVTSSQYHGYGLTRSSAVYKLMRAAAVMTDDSHLLTIIYKFYLAIEENFCMVYLGFYTVFL